MGFGKELQRLREKAAWSPARLAMAIGVPEARLRKWEERDTTPKNDRGIIEQKFKISLEEIMELEELPNDLEESTFISDAAGLIINKLIIIEAKLNIIFANDAERMAKTKSKKATDLLRDMHKSARLEAEILKEELKPKEKLEGV